MFSHIPPQLIALAGALSYAISGIAARRGLRYSTPITVTVISLMIHATGLWTVLYLSGGVPRVSRWVLFLFFLTGTLQPLIRWLTYSGIYYMGASRGTTVRGAHPLFSTTIAILFLGEKVDLWVLAGTISIVAGVTLISWRPGAERDDYCWWHIGFPLGAAFLAGVSHPLRRYALKLADEPLLFAATVGLVSLFWMATYLLSPLATERPMWNKKAMAPFVIAGIFETLGILLVIVALSVGQVVIVSPIVATSPLWILVGTWLFLHGIEELSLGTVLGALFVVIGTIAISVMR